MPLGWAWVTSRVNAGQQAAWAAARDLLQGETARDASGTRPGRVRFFKFYRAGSVRDASAAVSPNRDSLQSLRKHRSAVPPSLTSRCSCWRPGRGQSTRLGRSGSGLSKGMLDHAHPPILPSSHLPYEHQHWPAPAKHRSRCFRSAGAFEAAAAARGAPRAARRAGLEKSQVGIFFKKSTPLAG
eukprot:gene24719-biopygen14968